MPLMLIIGKIKKTHCCIVLQLHERYENRQQKMVMLSKLSTSSKFGHLGADIIQFRNLTFCNVKVMKFGYVYESVGYQVYTNGSSIFSYKFCRKL